MIDDILIYLMHESQNTQIKLNSHSIHQLYDLDCNKQPLKLKIILLKYFWEVVVPPLEKERKLLII